MLDGVADSDAESVEDDLSSSEEDGSKDDVADWPSIVERANNEDEL